MSGCLLLVVIREEVTAVRCRIANVHYLKWYAIVVCVHSPTSPSDSSCVYPKHTDKSEDTEVYGSHCMVKIIPDVGITLK